MGLAITRLNGRPIHVTAAAKVSDSLIAVGTCPYHKDMGKEIFTSLYNVWREAEDIRRTECEFDNLKHVSGWTQEQVVEFYEYGQRYGMMGLGAGLGELQKKAGNTTNFFKSITDASFSTASCMEKLSNYAKSEIESVLKFGIQ